MNILKNVTNKIILLPYLAINSISSLINRNRTDSDEGFSSIIGDFKYFISIVFWVVIGYFIFRSFLASYREVYACPADYSTRCVYVEGEYKTLCDNGKNCMNYYTKIIFSNKKVINFYYCEEKSKLRQICYAEGTNEAWILDYYGRTVVK